MRRPKFLVNISATSNQNSMPSQQHFGFTFSLATVLLFFSFRTTRPAALQTLVLRLKSLHHEVLDIPALSRRAKVCDRLFPSRLVQLIPRRRPFRSSPRRR